MFINTSTKNIHSCRQHAKATMRKRAENRAAGRRFLTAWYHHSTAVVRLLCLLPANKKTVLAPPCRDICNNKQKYLGHTPARKTVSRHDSRSEGYRTLPCCLFTACDVCGNSLPVIFWYSQRGGLVSLVLDYPSLRRCSAAFCHILQQSSKHASSAQVGRPRLSTWVSNPVDQLQLK